VTKEVYAQDISFNLKTLMVEEWDNRGKGGGIGGGKKEIVFAWSSTLHS